jgi:hypothetical protein
MNWWKCSFSVIKEQGVYAFVETLMPYAIHIRQTGGPEVLNWTPVRRLARELKQQDLGDFASK